MTLFKWLWHHIKNENWFSHLVMFFTTILGILIALELDKNREDLEQHHKIDQYRIRLENELKVNKGNLIAMKEWLQHDYILLELAENSEKYEGDLIVMKSVLDSLHNLDSAFRSLLIANRELPGNRIIVNKGSHIRSGGLTTDTWEALKGSDILQELTPKELLLYTTIFNSIKSFNGYYASAITMNDLYTRHKLLEVIENLDGFSERISNTLYELKHERQSSGKIIEIEEPQDVSKISRIIKAINQKKEN